MVLLVYLTKIAISECYSLESSTISCRADSKSLGNCVLVRACEFLDLGSCILGGAIDRESGTTDMTVIDCRSVSCHAYLPTEDDGSTARGGAIPLLCSSATIERSHGCECSASDRPISLSQVVTLARLRAT
jgi:hypothetical protein